MKSVKQTTAIFSILTLCLVAAPYAFGQCALAPGSVVTTTFQVTNTLAFDALGTATATLPPGLKAIPGSCVTNVGTCDVLTASSVSFTALVLIPNQTATITFKSQVADGTPTGTQLCIAVASELGGQPLAPIQSCVTTDCPATGPGILATGLQEANDQLPGSVLIYNLYTSNAAAPNTQNTAFSVTNIDAMRSVAVHMFYVDGASCSVSDRYTCLSPSQTARFLATDMDPGITGYMVLVATDLQTGCPVSFNNLIGDAFIKFNDGRASSLSAEGIVALAGGLPACSGQSLTATLAFDGVSYARLGRVLAGSSVPSAADGNSTMLVVNRIAGSLQTGPAAIGNLFGVLYDDSEVPHSFVLSSGACQLRGILSNTLPRTVPNFEVVIPAGHTGWIKVWREPDAALTGALVNFSSFADAAAGAFSHGRNLQRLTLNANSSVTIPIFPPSC